MSEIQTIREALELALHDLTSPQHEQHYDTVPRLRAALAEASTLNAERAVAAEAACAELSHCVDLLRRVECGATTARDAATLARLLGVEWTEQLPLELGLD